MNDLETLIQNCKKCGDKQKLSCKSIQKRKSNLLILGESPAKDGWIVSGRAFYNKEGKLQSSGKILDRLLRLIGLTIDEINFTEACVCIIQDRKNLRTYLNNCRPILLRQLELFDCDIILPMGQFPTEAILGQKVTRLKDFVGKKFTRLVNGTPKTIIPIYHTSPANPLCYKGNEQIFTEVIGRELESQPPRN